MKLVLSHITGNANVRGVAMGLAKANLLAEFDVSMSVFPGGLPDRMASLPAFAELRRRSFDPLIKPYVKNWPWMEIGRLVSTKAGLNSLVSSQTGVFYIDNVCKNFDKRVAANLQSAKKNGAGGVYCYEDIAEYSFIAAKELGLKCIYDLPIGYWRSARKFLEAELERWPEWAETITGFMDAEAKLLRKENEIKLADHVFVASTFTASTIKDYPGKLPPVSIIPYGFPTVTENARQYAVVKKGSALKLLYVGSLSQRKGIANLFAAVEKLKDHVELTLVGTKRNNNCTALNSALAKHTWIPSLSHNDVLELMRAHDVLVFPSLFEGFGLVITEAMSQGTPVITTDRTAGPDLIENGKNGWLIEAGSTEALISAIENILYSPGLIARAGKEAMQTASLRPWEIYESEIAAAVAKIL